MQWFPDRKIVWAECTQPVSKYDLLVFDMDGVGRDLTVFDAQHPWNFVHPARVAYDSSTVFTTTYTSDAGSASLSVGETINEDGPLAGGVLYGFTETVTAAASPVKSGTLWFREIPRERMVWSAGGSGTFLVGDTVTGSVTGATGTIVDVNNGAAGDMVVDLLTSTSFTTADGLTNGGLVTAGSLDSVTALSFTANDPFSGASSGFTGDFTGGALAAHTQYQGALWKFGVAQSSGVVGQRIPVQMRGITQLACVAGTTSAQIMIPDEDLPQATPKAATTDPVMQIARTLTSVSGGLCWVVFNGERGHGSNQDNE